MKTSPNYFADRVCLNVLANSIDNAKACYEAAEGNIVLGVLSKNYDSDEAAIADMKNYQVATNNALSVGLGAGDPNQSEMVSRISAVLQPQHVNQVFTGAGTSRALLGQSETIVNALVSPTGKVGYVNIATGPLCSQTKAEYQAVAEACAANDFYLEPTGGIDLENFEEILQIAVDASVKKIIPHIYSSIIDGETGDTRPGDVQTLAEMTKKVLAAAK